jgi:glycosyltransferase involved in cell wall biosynthesis
MPAIHQLVAGFSNGDAISNEARVLRRMFRSWGLTSEIYCNRKYVLPELRQDALPLETCEASCKPDDIAFLHLSMGSLANELFERLPCRKVLLYHNVTPPVFFRLVNEQTAHALQRGIEQVKRLAHCADINLADSAFNASELTALGYRDVRILPLVLDLEPLWTPPDRAIISQFKENGDDTVNVLFVGRCAPNKCIEDALLAFALFHRHVQPKSRFIHVGSSIGTERYYHLIKARLKDMGIEAVHFAGSVPQAQLNAYYKCADLFLCMSEHEGFCIPIIESMVHDIPVLAYDAGAVRETMDGAGVLVGEKNFELIAELMGELVTNAELRQSVVRGQRNRVERLASRNLEQELKDHLNPLLNPDVTA